jgi:putative DNA primase/helicase
VAPSGGRCLDRDPVKHPHGSAWRVTSGSPLTLATITAAERDALWAVTRLLDATPTRVADSGFSPSTALTGTPRANSGVSLRPGDDFDARGDWRDILEPHGWRIAHPLGSGWAWTRPGKRTGISATSGQHPTADRLYVFSTSTVFPAGQTVRKFHAYAHLNHGGSYPLAAAELRRAGYGGAA